MNYRPSKAFVYSMAGLCPVVAALWFGLLPEIREMEVRAVPGEITFDEVRTGKPGAVALVSARPGMTFGWSMDWFQEKFEDVMTWEHNPWKRSRNGFGDHFIGMLHSKDPVEKARAQELLRQAEAWHKRLLERYPELAVEMREIPADRNGFLRWLEFSERMEETLRNEGLPFPAELQGYLGNEGAWNAEAAKSWLAQNKALLDEIRAIGLLPERSLNGISVDRTGFIPARFAKSCGDALMIEARLAAEMGNPAGALDAVRAANGLADHLGEVESPSLLAATVQILTKISLQNRVLTDILPALPDGQRDPAMWQTILNPKAAGPAEFARLMKSEWSVGSRNYLLPMLLDTDDPKIPSDGAALLDYYSSQFSSITSTHEGTSPSDLAGLGWPSLTDDSHLSRSSRDVSSMVFVGAKAWRKGWERAQSVYAMNEAAFAILQGQPVPKDPVHGADYRWDPQNRVLSPPDTDAFREMKIDPITLPKF